MSSNEHQPPLERIFDLNRLSEAGFETEIEATPEQLRALAQWAEVSEVKSFRGLLSLSRLSASRFSYAADLEADIVQTCAVTLEPVSSHIKLDFTRSLHLVSQVKKLVDFSGELSSMAGDEAVPEEIDSPRFDLAAPLLEEFLLAIDPYPRAPGVAFESPQEEAEKPQNPFAILKSLKTEP
jgi:uncharacterized metal-binding protein YceD (DUF177 family)